MQAPKLGEAVAFRRMISSFERGTVFDEATMERIALSRGLRLRYVSDATVRNRGPETLSEYLRHRSRNIREHLALASGTGYRVSTLSLMTCLKATWRLWRRGGRARYILLTIGLEMLASARAHVSLRTGRPEDNMVWDTITTSKRVIAEGHVLRLHHDTVQKLYFRLTEPSMTTPNSTARAVLSRVKSSLRADDHVGFNHGQLILKFPSDERGAIAVIKRLRAKTPEIEHQAAEHVLQEAEL